MAGALIRIQVSVGGRWWFRGLGFVECRRARRITRGSQKPPRQFDCQVFEPCVDLHRHTSPTCRECCFGEFCEPCKYTSCACPTTEALMVIGLTICGYCLMARVALAIFVGESFRFRGRG